MSSHLGIISGFHEKPASVEMGQGGDKHGGFESHLGWSPVLPFTDLAPSPQLVVGEAGGRGQQDIGR